MPRLVQFDGLRAIAVGCVLIFHFTPSIDRLAPLGSIGVRLFFVLSGFLITRILLNARDQGLAEAVKSFYLRRSLRIFPVFYLVLAIAWLMNIGPLRSTIGWHVTYLTNAYLLHAVRAWAICAGVCRNAVGGSVRDAHWSDAGCCFAVVDVLRSAVPCAQRPFRATES